MLTRPCTLAVFLVPLALTAVALAAPELVKVVAAQDRITTRASCSCGLVIPAGRRSAPAPA